MNKNIDMEDLFSTFLTAYKQTHVSVNGQQAQIDCSRLWREIKKGKDDNSTKSEVQNVMLQWKVNAKKPGKGSIVNFFAKQSSKNKGELFLRTLYTLERSENRC